MHKLLSYLAVPVLFISFSFLLSSCEKEYSYEGGIISGSASGTAVYTLVGAGGNCSSPVISGQYNEGTPLTTANTVQLTVKVDSIGTYAITTNSADNFSFSSAGSFTTTGIQKITFTANGTPASAGNVVFTPPVGSGCIFIINVIEAGPVVGKFTFNGAPNSCKSAQVVGDYIAGGTLTKFNTINLNINVTAIGPYSIITDTLDGITFSASGSFNKVGDQTVTLTGSGTPEFARYLSFSAISAGTQACSFGVTVVDPGPLATYVLESGFGDTTNPCIYTVQGTVTHNVALNNSNTVTMRVYVSVLGNFTVATNTVNGMTFSYSGSFTTLNAQYIVLTGTGIPLSPGTYTFAPNIVGPHPLGGQTCSFKIEVL